MSTQNPNIPTATQAKGISATILDIQTHLDTSLVWLTNGMGRAYRLTKVKGNDNTVFLPEVYLGGNQFKYFAATPDNDKKGQSIFILGNETYLDYKAGWYGQKNYELSIIFSINLKLIDPTLLLTENFARHQIMDAEEALTRGLLGKGYKLVIDNCVTEFDEVFSGFDVSKDYGASLAPMSYFRFNCTVTLDEDCTGVTLDRCGAITQNLTRSDICSCILPSLEFSGANSYKDCLSAQQISDISVCPDVFYFTSYDGLNESTEIPDITETNGVSKLTISYWFKQVEDFDSANGKHGGKFTSLTSWIETSSFNGNAWFILSNTTPLSYGTGTTALNQNQWYHFVGVFDGTQTGNDNRMQIYIDGVRETLNFTGTIPSLTPVINANWRLGVAANQYGFFFGDLDEYSIWGSAWTQAQVTQVYNSGKLNTDYTGITNGIARWKLDALNPLDQIGSNNGVSTNQDSSNIIGQVL